MAFEDIRVHVRLRLFALWCSIMFFYIYGDYIELYVRPPREAQLQVC